MFADDEHDGPEPAEEPTAARDGERHLAPVPDGSTNGSSVNDRVDDEEEREPEPGEQFELLVEERGAKVTLSSLIRRGVPQSIEPNFESKKMPQTTPNLVAFGNEITVLMDCRPGKVEVEPKYDSEGNVEHVTLRPHFKPLRVFDARTEAARVRMEYLHAEKVETG